MKPLNPCTHCAYSAPFFDVDFKYGTRVLCGSCLASGQAAPTRERAAEQWNQINDLQALPKSKLAHLL